MDEPPRRLIDDPAMSSSLRDDLTRAGQEHRAEVAAYDAAGKLAGLQAALASQGSGAGTIGLVAKLALGVAAASAFMAAGAALHARLQRHDAPATAAPIAPSPPVPAQQLAPAQPAIEPAQPAIEHAAPSRRATAAAAKEPRRPSYDHGAAHEAQQLARIRAFLQAGDAAQALELAERGQRELGDSALWHEREALAVLALLELDRVEQAERRSALLLVRFPNSPFRAQLERRLRRAHED